MPNQSASHLNRVFQGLTDPTRRAVLERLSRGPAAASELAEPFSPRSFALFGMGGILMAAIVCKNAQRTH